MINIFYFQQLGLLFIRRPVSMTYFSIAATVGILGAFILLNKLKKRKKKEKGI